jgi:hypothetical protein
MDRYINEFRLVVRPRIKRILCFGTAAILRFYSELGV